MVDKEEISILNSLDIMKLEQVLERYPWFALGRARLLELLHNIGDECFNNKFRDTSAFVQNTSILYNKIMSLPILVKEPTVEVKKEIYVVGGDYFSVEDLNEVKRDESPIEKVGEFLPKGGNEPLIDFTLDEQLMKEEDFNSLEFYTETLAKIFTEQECYIEAINVYEKLSLLYPEKSAYFANSINEIKLKKL